ncbi:MAG: transglutaminase family protein [Rhodospirillaceae bacterium]|nr:MAG: transglutaminase family protein [Rhodospirillaceae bacterium]
MRINIQHQITCAFDSPIPSLIQILRLTPRTYDGQFVRRWQIDVDIDAVLKAREDSFGNITHVLTLAGPFTELTIAVDGEVETQDTHGVVAGAQEPFPTRLYLRETPLTHPGAGLAAFAQDIAGEGSLLDRLHALLIGIHERVDVDTAATKAPAMSTAAEAFVLRRGVCQDLAHIFIACARSLGIPARYISGYMFGDADESRRDASHGWAEAFVDGLGWVGFDAANCICATDAYVRVSVGLDYFGAAPIRAVHNGAAAERRTIAVAVGAASVGQAQEQHQT